MTEPWVSVGQIAEHLVVTRDSIHRWIDRKGLPAHRVGQLWKFKTSEVDDWVRWVGWTKWKADPFAKAQTARRRTQNEAHSTTTRSPPVGRG